MRFEYCPLCGEKLSVTQLGDEKDVPWCGACGRPFFPVYPCAVCVLALNGQGEGLFVTQRRIPGLSLITGFIQPGETAEQAAKREAQEEAGLTLTDLRAVGTHWYARDGVLMVLIRAHAREGVPSPGRELTDARFLPLKTGLAGVDPASTAVRELVEKAGRTTDDEE